MTYHEANKALQAQAASVQPPTRTCIDE